VRRGPSLLIAIVIALFGAFSYFSSSSTNDVTGEVQHIKITPQDEVALGLQALPQMEQQFGGEIENQEVLQYVKSVGQKVVAGSAARSTPYQYDFHVLRDPETINAFALPGGQVSITVGLLRRLKNEAELSGVLGHEVGHVVARHSAEQLAKQQFAQTLVGAAGVASYDPNHPMSAARNAAIAQAVSQMVNMSYGRNDELEADALGVKFMKQSGYDPRGMAELMEILAQAGGSRTPEFFSTHPNPENRLAKIEAEIQQVGGPGGDLGEARFQAKVGKYLK
jgi:predicted Zn-dependent protease